MLSIIVADAGSLALDLQGALLRCGCDCAPGNIIASEVAPQFFASRERSADIVFAVFSLDVEASIQSVRQLRAATTARLVAVGPTHDPHLILRAVHSGADDYVDAEASLDVELAALLKRMLATKSSSTAAARLIAVTGASGGSGRSLLAANIAAAVAQKIGGCGLCDLNLRGGNLAALLNLRPRYTIAHLFRDLAKLDRAMFERSLVEDPCGIRLLAAPAAFSEVDHADFRGLPSIIKLARQALPYVLVDLEHYLRKESLQVLQLADAVLVVVRLDVVSLHDSRRLLDELTAFGMAPETIHIVANRYEPGRHLSPMKAETALGRHIWAILPEDSQSAVLSFNIGRPVALESPASRLGKAILKLADDVLSQYAPAGGARSISADARDRVGGLAAWASRLKAALT